MTTANQQNGNAQGTDELVLVQSTDSIHIADLLYMCLARWRWFVVSLIVILGITLAYLLTTPPSFTRYASLLIKETSSNKKSISSDVSGTFANMGLFTSNTNVVNELITIQAPTLMEEVVRRLRLNVTYKSHGRFYKPTLYGKSLPLSVQLLDQADRGGASFTLEPGPQNGQVVLSQLSYPHPDTGKLIESDTVLIGQLNDTLSTPAGRLIISLSPAAVAGDAPFDDILFVQCSSVRSAARHFSGALTVDFTDEESSILDLTIKDVNTQRAEDILTMLIEVYNENWVKDKNLVAVSTSQFINERLAVIESELGNVDSDISTFKSENLLPNVEAASSMYMSQSTATNAEILDLNTQLSLAKYIRDYVTTNSNDDQLLPANTGLESAGIENIIASYNDIMLQRNTLVAGSSTSNPLVKDLDQTLAAMRGNIVSSIDNHVVTLNTRIKDLEKSEQQTTARIAANPTQAKYLLSVERQQKVKEALYLFLLQKREENELSQAFTAYNTRVITPPMGPNYPSAPAKKKIFALAFLVAIILPAIGIFVLESMNTTVRGRKDIEKLTLPFVGEIPLTYHRRRRLFRRKKADHEESANQRKVVVKQHSRNVINEAFRVVRTNLEFMLPKTDRARIIMLTSANSGSGKTFITMNLAAALAIKNKRALAIDLDQRKASLSHFVGSPQQGVADYLASRVPDYQDLIVHVPEMEGFDVLPVGTMPPNPTELLFSTLLPKMLGELAQQYDYIFIDCTPVEIVADASIIAKLVDATLFIIRAGRFERNMLPEVERYYAEKRYPNMAILLNGTESASTRYGYKYGYKYGYNYGYSYGYGSYTKE